MAYMLDMRLSRLIAKKIRFNLTWYDKLLFCNKKAFNAKLLALIEDF